ncbi:MAG: hypothetical protein ACR2MQ_03565 [Gemmatimonadaceae bacterium]
MTAAALSAITACGKGDAAANGANREPAVGKITANAPSVAVDPDVAAQGKALPTGYMAQFDQPAAKASDVSYSAREPGRWEVTTGPAHILYSPTDSVRGKYTASATFEQLQAPSHPEGFGVFVGGSKLDQPNARKYTYFIVRGDGKYLVKVRDGANTRTITDWTTNAAIPKQDAAGKGVYGIKVDVDGKAARVSVNGAPVTTIAVKDAPLDGVAGVRINHNLHLISTPITIVR